MEVKEGTRGSMVMGKKYSNNKIRIFNLCLHHLLILHLFPLKLTIKEFGFMLEDVERAGGNGALL